MGIRELVKTSYSEDDCKVLLKDLTSVMKPLPTEERERLNQSGVHYSEMLPEEKEPSEVYMQIYLDSVERMSFDLADWTAKLGEMILSNTKGRKPALISLARAGMPLGVLIKRYLRDCCNVECNHYGISIIRDKGIDVNAMDYIYEQEKGSVEVRDYIFIDGWVGKGVICEQLVDAVNYLKNIDDKWADLSSNLYVASDSANVTHYCATRRDCILPFACLNSTVSGLISRTILNKYVDVENGDFHGAVYFKQFESIDETNNYVNSISISDMKEAGVKYKGITGITYTSLKGMEIVDAICADYGIADYKKVKPGIGETTRVLLRRIPYKVLINSSIGNIESDADIRHILELCKQKNIPIDRYPLGDYKVCGVVKEMGADA